MVPLVPEEGGNTRPPPRISPSIRWCFTLHNWTQDDLNEFLGFQGARYSVIGEELGEEGATPHLQGYIEFSSKKRPFGIFKNGTIHWEKAKGSRQQNYAYCTKEGNRVWVNGEPEAQPTIISQLRPWQRHVRDICAQFAPDERAIYWFWEPTGGFGKSAMCKYLVKHHRAMVISGKAADMKHGIVSLHAETGRYPRVLILDIPRSVDMRYFSYTGIEEIKNGCFFSTKYESGMVLMPTPHIVIFSNRAPDLDEMSADRWRVTRLDEFVEEDPAHRAG